MNHGTAVPHKCVIISSDRVGRPICHLTYVTFPFVTPLLFTTSSLQVVCVRPNKGWVTVAHVCAHDGWGMILVTIVNAGATCVCDCDSRK